MVDSGMQTPSKPMEKEGAWSQKPVFCPSMAAESPHMVEGGSTLDITEVAWTVLPARQRPGIALCAFVVVIAVGVLVGSVAGDWIWGALAVVFLMATLSRFYLRSRIELSQAGVSAEFPLKTRRVNWEEIESIRHDDRGALIRLRRRAWLRANEFTILFGESSEEAIRGLNAFAPAGIIRPRRGAGETES